MNLQDAVRTKGISREEIQGNWSEATRHAHDNVRMNDWSAALSREVAHARTFQVAWAAKRLQDSGYRLLRDKDQISFDPDSDLRLVATTEDLVSKIGGLNLARRI